MTDHSTSQSQIEHLITTLTEQLTTLTRTLSQWMTSEPRSLGDLEQQVMRTIKDVGAALLAGVAHLAVPAYPDATTPCPCGQTAKNPRLRTATLKTVLGSITLRRPYYTCAACHHGIAPLDHRAGDRFHQKRVQELLVLQKGVPQLLRHGGDQMVFVFLFCDNSGHTSDLHGSFVGNAQIRVQL